MRRFVAALLEIAGIAGLTVAGFTISVTVGWFIAGGGLVLFGVATDLGATVERRVMPGAEVVELRDRAA